jgi:hypothetical protein
MSTGIRLKRLSLRRRHPNSTTEEIDALLAAWLQRNE